jgi:hypothetical protein
MLRTTALLLAGALVAGCQSTGVHGNADYHGDVYGQTAYHGDVAGTEAYGTGRVAGEKSYGTSSPDRTASAQHTTTIERTAPEPTEQTAGARTEVTRRTDVTPAPTAGARPEVTRRTETVTPTPNAAPRVVAPARNNTASGFPTGMTASNNLTATALIDHAGDSVRIANASDKDVRDARVWIDGTYFARVSSIPSRATVTIDRKSFVNGSGNSPTTLKDAKSIQIQMSNNLYNLHGPVMDDR